MCGWKVFGPRAVLPDGRFRSILRHTLRASNLSRRPAPPLSLHPSAFDMADKAAVRARFESVFPVLVKELSEYVSAQGFPEAAIKWFQDNLNYNTPGGKLNRGLSVVDTYAIITGRKSALDLPEGEYTQAAILGWCIELLQAYFLVADDMMDKSVTRRGQPCWYRVDHVGEIAINDAFMLEGAIYFLLKKHFRQHAAYVDLLELFHDVTFQTELGQLIDLLTAPEDHVDLEKFTLHKCVVTPLLLSPLRPLTYTRTQAPPYRRVQDGILFILPACCPGCAPGRRSG